MKQTDADPDLKRLFEMHGVPSVNARERLARRLDQAAARERKEGAWLRGVSAVLALTVGALGAMPAGRGPELEGSTFFTRRGGQALPPAPVRVNADAVPVAVRAAGVRLYWIFRD